MPKRKRVRARRATDKPTGRKYKIKKKKRKVYTPRSARKSLA